MNMLLAFRFNMRRKSAKQNSFLVNPLKHLDIRVAGRSPGEPHATRHAREVCFIQDASESSAAKGAISG